MAIIIRFLAIISFHVVWIIIMCKMMMHYIPTTIVHETNNYCHILCMYYLVAHLIPLDGSNFLATGAS